MEHKCEVITTRGRQHFGTCIVKTVTDCNELIRILDEMLEKAHEVREKLIDEMHPVSRAVSTPESAQIEPLNILLTEIIKKASLIE